MEDKVKEYKNINLSQAENGYVLSFCCCMEKDEKSRGVFDEMPMKHKEMVFKDDELDEALKKYKEMLLKNRKKATN